MKRYANIALVVGILLILYSFLDFSLNQIWDWVTTVSLVLGLGIAGLGIYYRLQIRQREFSRRTLQYGANSILTMVIVLGIIVLLAFITNRHNARVDLTEKGLFSLAEQTKSVLKDLKQDVQVHAFYKKPEQTGARDIMDEYANVSGHFKYTFIDPNEKPQIARQYKVEQYNTVVVESAGKREVLTELNESKLTNAIIKVTRKLDKVIYFLTGHGEKGIEDEGPKGMKLAADGIKAENYLVKSLNLAVEKKVPQDCSVLIIAGPKAEFFQPELDSLANYINTGGKVLVLLDPQWKPGLVDFLAKYKTKVGDNIVVDASGMGQLFGMGPEVPLVSRYEKHDIFKNFKVMTFYPQSCSVETGSEGESGFTAVSLFKSGPNSWGEADYMTRQVTFNNDRDIKGPVSMAVVSTKTISGNKKAHVMTIGDSDFASNAYIRTSGNFDLFLNEVNWLAEEEDMITVRPRQLDDRRVNLTAKDSKVVLYTSVFALPLLVIVAGVVIYFRRR